MKNIGEFLKKHKVALLVTGGLLFLYWYLKNYYQGSSSSATSQGVDPNSLVYGYPYQSSTGGSSGATSSSVPLANVTGTQAATTDPASTAAPASSTASASTPSAGNGGSVPLGVAPSGNAPSTSGSGVPNYNNPAALTASQLSGAGLNIANPAAYAANDLVSAFQAEGYTGNAAQDAALARQNSQSGAALFEGSPTLVSGGGTGAPPEIVAACDQDQANGIQCGSPGSASDIAAFNFGLPTQGNYELVGGKTIQIPGGVTPVGETPEELANAKIYTAANGVTFVNGQPLIVSGPGTTTTGSGGSQAPTPTQGTLNNPNQILLNAGIAQMPNANPPSSTGGLTPGGTPAPIIPTLGTGSPFTPRPIQGPAPGTSIPGFGQPPGSGPVPGPTLVNPGAVTPTPVRIGFGTQTTLGLVSTINRLTGLPEIAA